MEDRDVHDGETYDAGGHDVVGIGLGPSNLGLAAAISEHNANVRDGRPLTCAFLEQRTEFAWHPGMLLDGTTMQIAFLKDLATMRNPRSPFTFLQYLTERDRLVDFINHQTFFPSRIEFADYLRWASEKVDGMVRYGRTVTDISPLGEEDEDGMRFVLTVHTPDGVETYRARSVVTGTGLAERVPDWARADDLVRSRRVFHNHRLREHLDNLPDRTVGRMLVVGAGQSAAEVVQHLHARFPDTIVESIVNSYGFSPADDSPFANRVFDPSAVDDFFHAPPAVRADLMARHRTTNYACVDIDLIDELYRTAYQEQVTGTRRLVFTPATRVVAAETAGDAVRVTLHSALKDVDYVHTYDAVVLTTGFTSRGVTGLVSGWGLSGRISVARDYRLEVDGEVVPGLFVQGATEETHGLASTLLSNVAARSGELLDTLLTVEARPCRVTA